MKIIISIIIAFILFVVTAFWMALRDKTYDISNKEPYIKILNNTMITKSEMILATNLPEFKIKEQNFISTDTVLFQGVQKIALLPKNTEVKFTKAYEHTGGTSGITYIVLTGNITIKSGVYNFEYLVSVPYKSIDDFNLEPSSKEFLQNSVEALHTTFVKK